MKRRLSKEVNLAGLLIGGRQPIVVQSMNDTKTADIEGTLKQIHSLKEVGCELTRLAVPDFTAALALKELVKKSPLPLVADIHFDYRLALEAIKAGVAKIRINPGNMGSRSRIAKIAQAAKERSMPIRVGVNSGSISSRHRQEYDGVNEASLVASALEALALLEAEDFNEIIVSIKSSNPRLCINAYQILASKCNYPLHLGITETGTAKRGIIRSAVGIGALLAQGIGDTIRVSLTAPPEEEVKTAYRILQSLELRKYEAELISCPTCGRTEVALAQLAEQVEKLLEGVKEPIKVAVMGCVVNGPGEAREADCGIAGGKSEFLVFRSGKVVAKVKEDQAMSALKAEIDRARKKYSEESSKN